MLEPELRALRIFFKADQDDVQVRTEADKVIGRLDPRFSRIVRVLDAEPCVELEANVIQSPIKRSSGAVYHRSKQRQEDLTKSKARSFSCSVILYGTMDRFEDIGDFLSQCSEYLQSPLGCNRNVPYKNPQSICGREEVPSTTHQLEAQRSFPAEIEVLTRSADPSSALETENSFPETEASAAIRTSLYR